MITKVCTDATSLINTEDGDRGESNQADLSRCAWTTSAVDGRVVWLCGGSSSTCSWTLRTWRRRTGGTSSASSFFQTGSLRLDIHKVNRPLRISGSCGRTSHKTERAANGVHGHALHQRTRHAHTVWVGADGGEQDCSQQADKCLKETTAAAPSSAAV